ncbi:MAG: hypothetical protein O9264_08390 [Leptospira sp.]|nr:hypothetical protein [Leptospira sp.]
MISLSIQRAFLLIIISFSLSLIGCSSPDPKTEDSSAQSSESKSETVNQKRVENIELGDPSKSDANATAEKKVGCVEGDCVNGTGKYIYDNGDIYTGSFKNDLRDGQGNFEYTDGEKFVGTYLEDKRQGSGTYQFKNGDKYAGEFKDGMINGKGIYTFSDGKSLNGEFQNDGMDGSGTLIENGKPKECKVAQRKLLCD